MLIWLRAVSLELLRCERLVAVMCERWLERALLAMLEPMLERDRAVDRRDLSVVIFSKRSFVSVR